MKACRDCRHVYVSDKNDRDVRCHHPLSLKEYPNYFTGGSYTASASIGCFRAIGDCGHDGKLFEPKAGSIGIAKIQLG